MRINAQAAFFVSTFALAAAAACSSDSDNGDGPTGGSGGSGGSAGSGMSGSSMAGMTMAGSNSMAGTPAMGGGGMGGTAGTAGQGGGGVGGMPAKAVCGDGKREGVEACDDNNTTAGDGCSATCTVEAGYECPTAGQACVDDCGDGMIKDAECDDGNTNSGDGCSNMCEEEDGWECNDPGEPCTGICGDGILADALCDDGNDDPGDGCDADCEPEANFVCDIPGTACRKRPNCAGGACMAVCGDGIKFNSEACDDGNVEAGDGCSATCTVETGFTCKIVTADPMQLAIPVTYRDFIRAGLDGAMKHPDQQAYSGANVTEAMVEEQLDGEGLPVYTGVCEVGSDNIGNNTLCPHGAQTTSMADFDQWYRDVEGVNLTIPGVILLSKMGNAYVFDGGSTFTPLTGKGWDADGKEALEAAKNFGFTTELRYFFTYQGDEMLEFSGDDDVWVFINNRLAVDIGGMHPKQTRSVTLGAQASAKLNLTIGGVYEVALFHAERAPGESNFKLTLTGFTNALSECTEQ